MLKKLLYGLLGLIALLLVIAIFVDGKMNASQSIQINAPVETVWNHVYSLRAMDEWSPWSAQDPNIKQTWNGNDGTVGSQQCWESKIVGQGCQTITASTPPNTLMTHIEFKGMMGGPADASVALSPNAEGTKATWTLKAESPYPFRVMNLFMNPEDFIQKDFKKGLEKLKALSE